MHVYGRLQASWIPYAQPPPSISSPYLYTYIFIDCAMARIIDFAAPLGQKAGPGHWNDLDMLEVGNGGMTYDEYGPSPFSSSPHHPHDFDSLAFLNVEHPQKPPDSRKRRDEHGKSAAIDFASCALNGSVRRPRRLCRSSPTRP